LTPFFSPIHFSRFRRRRYCRHDAAIFAIDADFRQMLPLIFAASFDFSLPLASLRFIADYAARRFR
jgi:hypothetical protein